jgi:hypothetical protein
MKELLCRGPSTGRVLEAPINKLNELGFVNHPRVIVLIGLAMILIGIGRIEWLGKALKLAGL